MNCTDMCLNTSPCMEHYLTFNAFNNSLDTTTIACSQVFALPGSVVQTTLQLETTTEPYSSPLQMAELFVLNEV